MGQFKHIPSMDNIDILIDDDGCIFIFCRTQNKLWTGRFTAQEFPSDKTARSRMSPSDLDSINRNIESLRDFGIV